MNVALGPQSEAQAHDLVQSRPTAVASMVYLLPFHIDEAVVRPTWPPSRTSSVARIPYRSKSESARSWRRGRTRAWSIFPTTTLGNFGPTSSRTIPRSWSRRLRGLLRMGSRRRVSIRRRAAWRASTTRSKDGARPCSCSRSAAPQRSGTRRERRSESASRSFAWAARISGLFGPSRSGRKIPATSGVSAASWRA